VQTADSILGSWAFLPLPAAGLLTSAVLYWRGWRMLSRQVPQRFPAWRAASFLSGLAVIYLAMASPLDAFASWLLIVHMVQHLMLTMIAPPLLLLGAPFLPILRGLPKAITRDALGPFLNAPLMHRIGGFLVHPLFAGPLFMASNILWHIPGMYELALNSPTWHQVEHFCFLATALLFWWPVIQPWPSRPVWPRWAMIPYLLIADLQNTALAGFLTFSESVLYSTYANAPRISGLSALDDQAGAGAVMWVPGSMAFLLPAGIIAMGYLSPQRRIPIPEVRHPPLPRPEPRPFDLLRVPIIGPVLRWKPFRPVVQSILFLLAVLVMADGFFGPQVSSMNAAGVLPWTHWRGLTVLALLCAGNLFCMVCPFTFVRDLGRRILPGNLRWPRALRSKWVAIALLVIFFWAYEFFDLWNSPWWTAWIVAAYFLAALIIDGLFRGASFCKFVCPIGQFHFVSSLASPLEVRVRQPDACGSCRTHDCLRGNADQRGCELELFLPRKSGNMDCTFCMDCIKACPHDNIGILVASPGADIIEDPPKRSSVGGFSQRLDITVLVGVIVAGGFLNAAAMTQPMLDWQNRLGGLIAPLFVLGLIVIPSALIALAAIAACGLVGAGGRIREAACGFAIGFVPLGFAMWLSHFVFHLLTASHTPIPVMARIGADLGLGKLPDNWIVPSLAFPELPGLQILLLNAGALFSLWILWRKSQGFVPQRSFRFFMPWATIAVILYALGVWIIFQPMELRGLPM
jgi:cytochrome c oxidase assembly factor CtaG/ferredoxin